MTGIFCSWASRSLSCIRSERSSTSARRPASTSACAHRLGVLEVAVGDRHDHDLDRRQPEREGAGVVLGDDADEALERAVDGVVDDDRALEAAVGRAVLEVEALRQLVVGLDGGHLPLASERVLDEDVDLRRVEGPAALDRGRRPCRPRRAARAGGSRHAPRTRRSRAASPGAWRASRAARSRTARTACAPATAPGGARRRPGRRGRRRASRPGSAAARGTCRPGRRCAPCGRGRE